MSRIVLFLTIVIACLKVSAQDVSIIPLPSSLKINAGTYIITAKTPIIAAGIQDKTNAIYLNNYLKKYYGLSLPIQDKGTKGIIITTKGNDAEGYQLEVTSNTVQISGTSQAGTFYGIQSFIQLLPAEKNDSLKIQAVSIHDQPAMPYRGLMLDVSRHFFPIDFIKKYIDYMALHKLNYFHWHLVDDQGWRIEIKKYPRLTSIGGYRSGTIIGRYPGSSNTNIKYGGFYTQEQIKEVVQYAAERHITVIPEIEMPGHASAAIAAYPFLSCFPDQPTPRPANTTWSKPPSGKEVQETWGVHPDVFCAGKDSTFNFLEDVLTEVIALFPSKYVHIGGDECPKTNWKLCPQCQRRIAEEHLKDEHALQSYFIHRIEKFLNANGKSIIGWDEILEGGLAPNATVMSWRGEKGGIEAARQKHNVIMTPNSYVYLDYQQSPTEDSVTITNNKSFLALSKVYSWVPVPETLNEDEKKYIIGGQANVWTEYMSNPRKVEYMLFPRIAAVSECVWTETASKNYTDFENRLSQLEKKYDLWNINYFKGKNQ